MTRSCGALPERFHDFWILDERLSGSDLRERVNAIEPDLDKAAKQELTEWSDVRADPHNGAVLWVERMGDPQPEPGVRSVRAIRAAGAP